MDDTGGSGGRRDFFRYGLGQLLSQTARALERAIVPEGAPLRPPGALAEAAFLASCNRCGDCATVCPVHAIVMLDRSNPLTAGTPYIDPVATACIACADMPCARACPTEALAVPADGWNSVRWGRIRIDENRCIAHRDVECGVCARVCPIGADALAMRDGVPVPGDACVGCGTCISACVTSPSSILFTSSRRTA